MNRSCQLFSLLLLSAIALADPSSEALQVCLAEKDSAARLACFDRAMNSLQPNNQEAVTQPLNQSKTQVQADAKPIEATHVSSTQPAIIAAPAVAEDNFKKVAPPPPIINSRITQIRHAGMAHVQITLENGQVWRETESTADSTLSVNDPVTLKPGALGSYFLKGPDQRSIRVQRIR